MEKEKLESLLIEYIDGSLGETELKEVEQLLAEKEEVRRLYAQLKEVIGTLDQSPEWEPSRNMKPAFEQILKKEIDSRQTAAGRQVFFKPTFFRAAAAIGVVLFLSGYWFYENRQQQAELARLRLEMEQTKQMMMAMLENQQSASTRVRGATVAYHLEKTDDQIVNVLVKTMNEDLNTNVRLAALEALGKFNTQPAVRKALIASLATQKDPVVQIALIQLMVQMKEKGAVKDLENMVNNIETMKAVKDEAYSGLLKLS